MYNFVNDEWYKDINSDLYRNNMNGNLFGNNMNSFINNSNMNSFTNPMMSSLFSPAEGYDKGNLFANLYNQYKNYKPVTLNPRNDREKMLLELSRAHFAMHELNLYLDNFPNDESMLTLFNDYRNKVNELMRQYEKTYGPLTIKSDSLNQSPFMWEKDVWPWEERF